MVCTLTVAAWDTLVLFPREFRLLRTPEWPVLKILFHFMRYFMPIEFAVVAVAFFDTSFARDRCQRFFLFEPIATAVLLACASAVHVIRIHAIYDKSRLVLGVMGTLFAFQIVATGIASGFYKVVPLDDGQGCIAGPKDAWVGIYWIAPTLLYTVSLGLALNRSIKSLATKPLSPWKLMLRDGLNLYGSIWLVNMANVLFWFIIRPDPVSPKGFEDPVRTIVTSMAAVLTTAMTLRIILSVRGSLIHGGSFALSGTSANSSSRTANIISTRSGNLSTSRPQHTYNLDEMRGKPESEWVDDSNADAKPGVYDPHGQQESGVKVTVDRQIGFDSYGRH